MDVDVEAILRSFIESPLLVGDFDEASVFDRSVLSVPSSSVELSLDQKLGHLYEDALKVLLDASDSVECLAKNLQVFDSAGRTIGEMDFILMDVLSRRAIHLELAIKFYLAVESEDGWEFPGPDPRDNWTRKLERLRNYQLCLGQRPEARLLLEKRFGIQELSAQHLIYGCVFYHYAAKALVRPEGITSEARTGRWLYVSEWETVFCGVNGFRMIEKAFWPVGVTASSPTVTSEVLLEQASQRCTMFAVCGDSDLWFLVPDIWPKASS